MSFDVDVDSYRRFMGVYSERLAPEFAAFAGVAPGLKVVDVGCGPGALTHVLADQLGAASVAAVDPSPKFVAAVSASYPGADVRTGAAESLPFSDGAFDVALAQLVVHFMKDPVAGLREMARVTAVGGTVAACVWDHSTDRGPLSTFWGAVHEIDPEAADESHLAGVREGQLIDLFDRAGLAAVEGGLLTVAVQYPSFEAWWAPYTLGVGPAGDYVAALDDAQRAGLLECCRARLPSAPFTVCASAWAARGTVAGVGGETT
jgi:SAM-dependent methyltransferase